MAASKPVIVIKKKSGHGGHHGGAWKVAYADFVTAMMSLFIVLWLMNTSEKVKQAVAGYFNDPSGKSTQTGTDQSGTSENLALTENNIPELKKKIEEAIRKMNDLKALQNQDSNHDHAGRIADRTPGDERRNVFRLRQRKAEQKRAGIAGDAVATAGRVAEPDLDRRPHGCPAVCVGRRVRELGSVDGSCERGAAGDADIGVSEGSGLAGAWVRGSEAAGTVESAGSFEPENFADRAVCNGGGAAGSGQWESSARRERGKRQAADGNPCAGKWVEAG
jgi:flagellar motor protein MotB